MKKYFLNLLVSIDQLINTIFAGDPDETLSSRMGKHPDCKPCRFVCWLLDFVDEDHCRRHIEHDEGKHDLLSKGFN